MPLYEYECHECEFEFERCCTIENRAIAECPKCGGRAYRIFSPPVIVQTGYKEPDARYNRGRGK